MNYKELRKLVRSLKPYETIPVSFRKDSNCVLIKDKYNHTFVLNNTYMGRGLQDEKVIKYKNKHKYEYSWIIDDNHTCNESIFLKKYYQDIHPFFSFKNCILL